MNNAGILAIFSSIGVLVVVLVFVFTNNTEPGVIEVEDTLDKEIRPIEIPEIEKKIEEIEKIAAENDFVPLEREWISSGPFQIDRSEYAIGEKIFIRIGGLEFEEKGQIAVMRPLNTTHYSVYMTIPFDEAKKSTFNYYLEPAISKIKGICSTDDIVGKWALVFRGTNYPNLDFEITDRIVPGTNIKSVC